MSQKQRSSNNTRTLVTFIIAAAGVIMIAALFLNAQGGGTPAAGAGAAFLAENAQKVGVVTTASGLQYRVITEGSGSRPGPTDTVTVNYRGTLIDGTQFDSSYDRGQPATFPLNQVIAGWTEGLQLMTVGSTYEFVIPSQLGYGASGQGPIPPNAVLIFEVELLGIN
jgi:FKBP-type peptidyl-prolyl cis-trans isomerase